MQGRTAEPARSAVRTVKGRARGVLVSAMGRARQASVEGHATQTVQEARGLL